MQGAEDMTDYEQQREAQVAHNHRLMVSLGLGQPVLHSTAEQPSNERGRANRQTAETLERALFTPVRRSNRPTTANSPAQDTRQPTIEEIAQWIYHVCEHDNLDLNGYGMQMGQLVLDTGLNMGAIELLVQPADNHGCWGQCGISDEQIQRLIHQSFKSLVDNGIGGIGVGEGVMGSIVEIHPGDAVLVGRAINMFQPMKARVLWVDGDDLRVEFTHGEFMRRASTFSLRPEKRAFIRRHEIVEVLPIQPGNLVLVSRAIDSWGPMKARVLRVDGDNLKVEFTHEEFIGSSTFSLRPEKHAFVRRHEVVEVLA